MYTNLKWPNQGVIKDEEVSDKNKYHVYFLKCKTHRLKALIEETIESEFSYVLADVGSLFNLQAKLEAVGSYPESMLSIHVRDCYTAIFAIQLTYLKVVKHFLKICIWFVLNLEQMQ